MHWFIAHLLVGCYVAGRDIARLGAAGTGALTALVVFGLLAVSLVDLAVTRTPLVVTPRVRRAATLVLLAVVPLSLMLWRWWQGRAFWPAWLPVVFAGLALLIGAASFWQHKWARLPETPLLGRGQVLWALLSLLAGIVVNAAAGTMAVVRAGTETLHVVLAVSTWASAAATGLLLGARPSRGAAEGRRLPIVIGAVASLVGFALLELDRHLLAGLYPELHAYLGIAGLLWLDTGLGSLLAPWRTWFARWRWPLAVLTFASVAPLALLLVSEDEVRARLEEAPLGESYLYMASVSERVSETAALPRHPALDYPRYFDAERPAKQYNILLVTIDALRGDQVGGASPNPDAPNLEGLAKSAVVFERAYAQGSRTAIGMSALMLGRYSANIDWKLFIYRDGRIYDPDKLSEDDLEAFQGRFVYTTMPRFARGRLLAERLRAAGYKTYATPFAGKNEFFDKENGFHIGFDEFLDLTNKRWRAPSSGQIAKTAIKQHERISKDKPWLQWIHFYDPHESHGNPERYARMVKQVDTAFGKIVAHLKKQQKWDDTIVAIIADHGEALGEHRHKGHGSSVFEEQVRVPLILRVPGIAPRHVSIPVAGVDLTATLAFLAGADLTELDGISLLPLMKTGTQTETRPIFTELHRYLSSAGKRTSDLKAVIMGRHKLVLDRKKNTKRLYDIEADPDESDNIAGKDPERLKDLVQLARSFFGNAEREHALP